MKNLSKVGVGGVDFETVGEIFSNLINSLFDESGNYIAYVEAIENAILKIIEMLQ